MHLSSSTPPKKARIEIIPLIDIMFFLLASFMLVSMSMIKLQKVDTNLPSSKTSAPQQKQDFVAVGIDAKGNYYFDKDKDPIAIDQVPVRLQPFYDKSKDDTKVFVNCDSAGFAGLDPGYWEHQDQLRGEKRQPLHCEHGSSHYSARGERGTCRPGSEPLSCAPGRFIISTR